MSAQPAAKNSAFLIFVFPVHWFSFSPISLYTESGLCVVNSDPDIFSSLVALFRSDMTFSVSFPMLYICVWIKFVDVTRVRFCIRVSSLDGLLSPANHKAPTNLVTLM